MPNRITETYDALCDLIIRPERHDTYDEKQLGPKVFSLATTNDDSSSRHYCRKDLVVYNSRGLMLRCSHFEPVESQRRTERMPCVIYCHGNCGSRIDALPSVEVLLPFGFVAVLLITVFAFDFSGSGLSEGEYVSLGFYEKQDVGDVVTYLMGTKRVSKLGLWGRSMGAATSIIYSSLDPCISAVVTDSPFTSLHELIHEMVLGIQSWIPRAFIAAGVSMVGRTIQTRAGFDIELNTPIRYASRCTAPILMGHGVQDTFIRISHSEKLLKEYGGSPKTLVEMEGGHNSSRPESFYNQVGEFFHYWLVWKDNFVNAFKIVEQLHDVDIITQT
ncbi:hypothetical protein AKO1_011239 [Acrasis kona]|uniref:AB hydrolase-1 domain-containing protein n=1 Tax=Acrasis kona TaxID=1008807 RepID=A0AAW2YWG8_9EUKA